MVAAFINGLVGLGLCFFIGIDYLNFNVAQIILCILISNAAALTSLLITLYIKQAPGWMKNKFDGSFKAWALLVGGYYGILIPLSPSLQNLHAFLYLAFPLILSTGFAILAFGPIQDFLVRRQQSKAIRGKRID